MNANDALLNRHTAKVSYVEPWPGHSAEGQQVDVHVTITMSVHDAVNFARKRTPWDQRDGVTDLDLLNEFIAVHWADITEA